MGHDLTYRYTHVEAGLVENVVIRRTSDTETYPSGWKYTLHLGTLGDLTLIRSDNAHEDTKGHERHTGDDETSVEFPGMEASHRRVLGQCGRVLGANRRHATTTLLTIITP